MFRNGDLSTYSVIVEREPYGKNCNSKTLQCIGHVQKRVGSKVWKLKSSPKRVNLSDGKGASGKSGLADAEIDLLQTTMD